MLRLLIKYLFKKIRMLLGLCLVGQGFIIALHLSNQQSPFQQIVQKQIQQKLSNYNLSFQAKKISISLNGRLDILEPSIFYQNNSQDILSADNFHIKINLLKLLAGKLGVHEIVLHDANLYCPAVFSPTGLNQKLINNLHASIKLKGKSHKIDFINFNLDNLTVVTQGSLRNNITEKTAHSKSLSPRQLFVAFQTILSQKSYLSQFEDPILLINLIPTPNKTIIDSHLHAQGFHWKTLELGPHHAHLQFALSKGKIRLYRRAFLEVNNFNWDQKLLAGPSFFRTHLPHSLKTQSLLPQTASIIFTNPHYKHLHADTLHYKGPIKFNKPTSGVFSVVNDREWAQGTLAIDNNAKKLDIVAQGAVHPQTLQPILSKNVNNTLESLIFSKEPLLHARLSFENNFAFKELQLQLTATNTLFQHLELDHFFAKAKISPEALEISDSLLFNSTTNVQGSYSGNFKTHDYLFLLTGNLNPKLLDPWMGKGWKNFWKDFQTSSSYPYAEGDIQGNWADPSGNQTFVHASAQNFSYLKIPFDKAELKLFVTPLLTQLQNIYATTSSGGQLDGHLELNYSNSATHKLERIYLNADSSLSLPNLVNLTNSPEINQLVSPLNCSTPPYLKIVGATYPLHTNNDLFSINFQAPTPLSYKNIPLDSLQTTVHYTPGLTQLNDIKIGFADGSGTGEATITKHKEDYMLAFNLSIDNANPKKATANIQSLGHEDDDPTNSDEKSNIFTSDQGLAHLDIEAVGALGDISSFTGDGNIEVTQGDLGKVHLFGILSRLLDTTTLTLGTFKLTNISAPFDIQNNNIYFPDLNIFGPTANIAAHGNYTIASKDLDFTMNIAPLGKIKIPLISHAFLLFSPISQSFQVQLAGTLEDPVWNVNITPFGLFKKKSSTAANEKVK